MHIPVLLHEVLEILSPKPGDTVIDGTIGGGGHAKMFSERIGEKGLLVGLDDDTEALERARTALLNSPSRVCLKNFNFRNIDRAIQECGACSADIVFFDLGFSSFQIEGSGRGFSFQADEPLLMTFRNDVSRESRTAYEIVNTFPEEKIEEILREYGEERFAGKIARVLVAARRTKRIETSRELKEIIEKCIGRRGRAHHPATKTFQAIRIAVNDELNALKEGLEKGFALLAPAGRMGAISFHSLEDRIVKFFFKTIYARKEAIILTKKPIRPSFFEVKENGRARSAKFRAIQKI